MNHEIKVFYASFIDKNYIIEKLQELYNDGFSILKTLTNPDPRDFTIMFIMYKYTGTLYDLTWNKGYVNATLNYGTTIDNITNDPLNTVTDQGDQNES